MLLGLQRSTEDRVFDLKYQTEAWHQSYRVDRGTRAEGQFSGANASKASVRRSGPIRLTAASVLLRKPNRAVCISPFAPGPGAGAERRRPARACGGRSAFTPRCGRARKGGKASGSRARWAA